MIKHAEIIRAILDGKTVQLKSHEGKWVTQAGSPDLLIALILRYPDDGWRIKPEPVVSWAPVWNNDRAGESRPARAVGNFADNPIQWLRLEFLDGKCVSVSLEDA